MRAYLDFPEALPAAVSGLARRWRARFENPVAILIAKAANEVLPVLEQVHAHALAGRWCVGEVAYEAASGLDAALPVRVPRAGWPLVRFAVYDVAQPCTEPDVKPDRDDGAESPKASPRAPSWYNETTYDRYAQQVERAQQAMSDGECYQVNLTHALHGTWDGATAADIATWFTRLRAAQPGGYQAWLDWGDQHVLSLSPELFFDWRPDGAQGVLTCQPMKGTAPRDGDPERDAAAATALQSSDKERAENVMIVDLLRNDMGRVAVPGSVKVQELFGVMALPTVWQMTSTLTARTMPAVGIPELFAALFPCGSVTGAPKARAMHWITALEDTPRAVYCGAVGVVRPGGAATFNVPIRTITLAQPEAQQLTPTQAQWRAHAGVGSAITFYANARAEWQELAAKTRYLERAQSTFELLETLLLENGRYTLLPEHLARMQCSAAYFQFAGSTAKAMAALSALALKHPQGVWRVRLISSALGEVQVQAFELAPTAEPVTINISDMPLDSSGRDHEFLMHKTTRRAHYDTRLRLGSGVFDTLLVNERAEITEFTRGNVALLLDGRWYTPPLGCGLLPGTERARLLAQGRITEQVLTLVDVERAQELAFFNSVRGWLRAVVQP